MYTSTSAQLQFINYTTTVIPFIIREASTKTVTHKQVAFIQTATKIVCCLYSKFTDAK